MQQGSLFDHTADECSGITGIAGFMPIIRAGMNRVAAGSEAGRKLLVDGINKVARREGITITPGGGKSITIQQLNKWLQPQEAGHAPSYNAVFCFCLATRDFSPLQPIFAAFGLTVIQKSELRFLEYGKECIGVKKSKAKMKALENDL